MPIAGTTDDPRQPLAAITEMDGDTIGLFAFAVTFQPSAPVTPVPAH